MRIRPVFPDLVTYICVCVHACVCVCIIRIIILVMYVHGKLAAVLEKSVRICNGVIIDILL